MKIIAAKNYEELSRYGAAMIADEIKINHRAILGLATGSTPIGVYRELIRMYKEETLDFSKITTFNLDEYYGLSSDDKQSYAYFMNENLFKHINIKKKNVYIPNGIPENVVKECKSYDGLIAQKGGIDLQLLGIGMNGHIGFNEPNEELMIGTHLVDLDEKTIKANSRFFNSMEEVPKQAITMGLGSIMKAKKILLIACGKDKRKIIGKIINGKCSTEVPGSILQLHQNVTVVVDEEIYHYLKNNRILENRDKIYNTL